MTEPENLYETRMLPKVFLKDFLSIYGLEMTVEEFGNGCFLAKINDLKYFDRRSQMRAIVAATGGTPEKAVSLMCAVGTGRDLELRERLSPPWWAFWRPAERRVEIGRINLYPPPKEPAP